MGARGKTRTAVRLPTLSDAALQKRRGEVTPPLTRHRQAHGAEDSAGAAQQAAALSDATQQKRFSNVTPPLTRHRQTHAAEDSAGAAQQAAEKGDWPGDLGVIVPASLGICRPLLTRGLFFA